MQCWTSKFKSVLKKRGKLQTFETVKACLEQFFLQENDQVKVDEWKLSRFFFGGHVIVL